MNALSRREEETLLKATKSYALKECDDVVKGNKQPYVFIERLVNLHPIQNLRRVHPDVQSLWLGHAGRILNVCKNVWFNCKC